MVGVQLAAVADLELRGAGKEGALGHLQHCQEAPTVQAHKTLDSFSFLAQLRAYCLSSNKSRFDLFWLGFA